MPKGTSKREIVLLILLFVFASFVRFYRFPQRMVYGPEQAISLITSGSYLSEKFSLLGQPDLIRNTSTGHVIYQNALFNYSLVPLQLIFQYDPLPITIFFTCLNLLTGLIIYVLTKRRHGVNLALLTTFLFLFSSTMIYHSLFIWILNYLPLLGILLYYFLTSKKKYSLIYIFIIGLLCGASFALEYAFIFVAFIVFLYVIWKTSQKVRAVFLFMLGVVIPNLTIIVFDLKHQFFHTQIFWQYAMDLFAGKTSASLSYYHFLSFWPIVCIFVAFLILKYIRVSWLRVILLTIYLFLNLSSEKVFLKDNHSTLKYPRYQDFQSTARQIAENKTPRFNVATLFDFDTRAHPLRYLLIYLYGQRPQPVENYSDIDALYVYAPADYDIRSPHVWELQSFFPYTITIADSKLDFILYKLTK